LLLSGTLSMLTCMDTITGSADDKRRRGTDFESVPS